MLRAETDMRIGMVHHFYWHFSKRGWYDLHLTKAATFCCFDCTIITFLSSPKIILVSLKSILSQASGPPHPSSRVKTLCTSSQACITLWESESRQSLFRYSSFSPMLISSLTSYSFDDAFYSLIRRKAMGHHNKLSGTPLKFWQA